MPDSEVIGKCFTELILDINKSVRLGYFFLEKKVEEKRGHNLPLY